MLLRASSFDIQSTQLLQKQKLGRVLRTYTHTLTLQFSSSAIVHLVQAHIGDGPKRIVLDKHMSTPFRNDLTDTSVLVQWNEKNILLGRDDMIIDFHDAYLWEKPLPKHHIVAISSIHHWISHHFDSNQFSFDEPFMVLRRIHTFIGQPTADKAFSILGLGGGSTPLGDDAILGVVLAQRFLGIPSTLNLMKPYLDQKTTALSSEMLLDALEGNYSALFIRWLQGISSSQSKVLESDIDALGGSSGKMIRYSFYTYINHYLKEYTHENISTYS